jgi:UDP-N-acetylglucosamine:LPS N-acetylglucosamine transferase
MKILGVSSVGGHLVELLEALAQMDGPSVSLVVNDRCDLPEGVFERVYRISHAERDWKVLANFRECAAILLAESPDVVLSAGAGPAVPMFLLAGLMGIRTVFVETAASISRLSLTGRLLLPVADHFFVQSSDLLGKARRARCVQLMFP